MNSTPAGYSSLPYNIILFNSFFIYYSSRISIRCSPYRPYCRWGVNRRTILLNAIISHPDRAMTTFTVREYVSSSGPSAVRIPTTYCYRQDGEKKIWPRPARVYLPPRRYRCSRRTRILANNPNGRWLHHDNNVKH